MGCSWFLLFCLFVRDKISRVPGRPQACYVATDDLTLLPPGWDARCVLHTQSWGCYFLWHFFFIFQDINNTDALLYHVETYTYSKGCIISVEKPCEPWEAFQWGVGSSYLQFKGNLPGRPTYTMSTAAAGLTQKFTIRVPDAHRPRPQGNTSSN